MSIQLWLVWLTLPVEYAYTHSFWKGWTLIPNDLSMNYVSIKSVKYEL